MLEQSVERDDSTTDDIVRSFQDKGHYKWYDYIQPGYESMKNHPGFEVGMKMTLKYLSTIYGYKLKRVIVTDNDEIVGYLIWSEHVGSFDDLGDGKDYPVLLATAVKPEYRNRGLLRKMINKAGLEKPYLVQTSIVSPIGLWEKMGCKKVKNLGQGNYIEKCDINENVSLSVKILKDRNIPIENENFISAKEYLNKNNSIGYLGFAVKMDKTENLTKLNEIVRLIIEKKEYIKSLPKNISTYNNFNELVNDLYKVENSRLIKKLTNKLTNKHLVKLIGNRDEFSENDMYNIDYFLKDIDSSDQKEFLSKTDRYRELNSFLYDLGTFVDDYKKGFYYEKVLNTINTFNEKDIKVLYNSNEMIFCRVYTYEGIEDLGSKAWCIVQNRGEFDHYTNYGENYQYVLFNFNINVKPNLKLIGLTLDNENNVIAAHDRYDDELNKIIISYLNSIGIKEKVYYINNREFLKNRINKIDGIRVVTDYGSYRVVEPTVKKVATELYEILGETNQNHLDLIIDRFEKFWTHLDYKEYPMFDFSLKGKKIIHSQFNVFLYLLNHFNSIMDTFRDVLKRRNDYMGYPDSEDKMSEDKFIEILKRIYISNIKISDETKFGIIKFLKSHGVDVLKLSQLRKQKFNGDLSSSEFNMLSSRGEDLRPSIQNKLSSIRRGEDVSMNNAEINYAIDNGYKEVIKKYYTNMLSNFREEQLSYDDLMVYKKLDMISDISKVIKSKVDIYGIETLNSYERSLYDYIKK